jgi:YHS domain-containing protein
VRDEVDRAKAVTKGLGGETFYFCSEHCLHAFELAPEQYLEAGPKTLPVENPVARQGG